MRTTDKVVLNYLKEKCRNKPWQYQQFTVRDFDKIENLTPYEILTSIDRLELTGEISCYYIGDEGHERMVVRVTPKKEKNWRAIKEASTSEPIYDEKFGGVLVATAITLVMLFIIALFH